jgi:uncharacterized protein (DUF885 family)
MLPMQNSGPQQMTPDEIHALGLVARLNAEMEK